MIAKVVVSNGPEGLAYLIAVALFLAPLIAGRLSPRPFFGGLFVLAFAPFLSCALVGAIRSQAIATEAEYLGRYDPDNMVLRLHEVYAPVCLGLLTTMAALGLHFALCALTRHRPNQALQRTEASGTSSLQL